MFLALLPSPVRQLRSFARAGIVVGILAALLGRAAPAAAQNTTLEIYDARDLSMLCVTPPEGRSLSTDKPPLPSQSPFASPKHAGEDPAAVARLDQLVSTVASTAGAACTPLMPGVYAITGEREAHQTIRTMLTQLREMGRQRFELDLVIYPVDTAAAPPLGTTVTADSPDAVRLRTTVLRRLPAPIDAITRTAYISDWQPVVSDNAVGNDPTTSEVISGLTGTAIVGAGPDSAESITLQISGRLTRATVMPAGAGTGKSSATSGPASEGLGIGLPQVDERVVHVDIGLATSPAPAPTGTPGPAPGPVLPASKLTAIAVLPGFEDGRSLVIAASVRALP
jgi:hypothetical protein